MVLLSLNPFAVVENKISLQEDWYFGGENCWAPQGSCLRRTGTPKESAEEAGDGASHPSHTVGWIRFSEVSHILSYRGFFSILTKFCCLPPPLFFCGCFLSLQWHPDIPPVTDFGQSVLFIVSISLAAYCLWDSIDFFYSSFSFHMDSVQ